MNKKQDFIKIRSFDHISLYVSDLSKSCDFYENLLFLSKIDRPAFDFGGAWFEITPQVQLHLIAGKTPTELALSGSRKNHFALKVDSVAAVANYLQSKDYIYIGPKQRPDWQWQLFLQDPDGYWIEFTSEV